MEIPQSKAYEIVGQQQIEIVVLREHIRLLQGQIDALQKEKSNGAETTAPKAKAKAPAAASPKGSGA